MPVDKNEELIDKLTSMIDSSILSGHCSTYKEWQEEVEKIVKDYFVFDDISYLMKKPPWTCGNCGQKEVKDIRNEGEKLVGTCSLCGTEWVA